MVKLEFKLASLALPVMGMLVACSVCACRKEKPDADGVKPAPKLDEVYVAEGNSYMHDPVFRAALAKEWEVREEIGRKQLAVTSKMQAILEECGGDKAKAEARADYQALMAETKANARAYEESRSRAQTISRNRILRAQEDSKRVQRGEAKAIEVNTIPNNTISNEGEKNK